MDSFLEKVIISIIGAATITPQHKLACLCFDLCGTLHGPTLTNIFPLALDESPDLLGSNCLYFEAFLSGWWLLVDCR